MAPPLDDKPHKPATGALNIDREKKTAAIGMPTRRRRLQERRVQTLLIMWHRLFALPGTGRAVPVHRSEPTLCLTSRRPPNRGTHLTVAAKI